MKFYDNDGDGDDNHDEDKEDDNDNDNDNESYRDGDGDEDEDKDRDEDDDDDDEDHDHDDEDYYDDEEEEDEAEDDHDRDGDQEEEEEVVTKSGKKVPILKKKVAGKVDFFYSLLNPPYETWRRIRIIDRRVTPEDKAFQGNLGLLAIACPNFRGLNNGGRGHTAMVFHHNRWHLVLVWRLEIDSLVCFVVNRTPNGTNKSHYLVEQKFDLIGEETEFVFVSLYGFDSNLVTDPAFLNEKDGKLNVGIRPSSMFIPAPPSLARGETPEPRREKIGRRKRSKRGGCRGTSSKRSRQARNVPDWLRGTPVPQNFLVIYVTKKQMEESFLSLFAKQPFRNSMGQELYVMQDPFWRPMKDTGHFAPAPHYMVSKADVEKLNGASNSICRKLLATRREFYLIRVNASMPIRLILWQASDLEVTSRQVREYQFDNISFHYEVTNETALKLPGVAIAVWVQDPDIAGSVKSREVNQPAM